MVRFRVYRKGCALKFSERIQQKMIGSMKTSRRFYNGKIHDILLSGHQTEHGYKWRRLSRIIAMNQADW